MSAHLTTVLAIAVGLLVSMARPASAQDLVFPIFDVPVGVTGYIGETEKGVLDTPTHVSSFAAFETLFGSSTQGLSNPWLAPSVRAFFAEGGTEAWIVRTADATAAALIGVDGGPGARTGLAALMDVDEVSAVVAPGVTSSVVQNAMIQHCRAMGDRIAILDPMPGAEVAGLLAQRSTLAAPDGFGALYAPWIEAFLGGTFQSLPPSGFLAAVFAKSDPYRSPVDVLATASGVATEFSSAQIDVLNPEGVNPIRSIPSQGIRVWGARTLSTSPEFVYLAVRRAENHLRESIVEGTAPAADEPNTQPVWDALRAAVESYLFDKWVLGWFPGVTPEEAYFVRCDLTTMTQNDLLEGRTVILVGFAPLRPAEFVVFRVEIERVDATDAPRRPGLIARLTDPSPNPFNPRTRIAFELERAAQVRLDVFDVAGRRVDTLLDGASLPAGRHECVWQGRDVHGRPVASGVYTVRLHADGVVDTRRVTLVE